MAGFQCLRQRRKGGSALAMEGEFKKLPLIGSLLLPLPSASPKHLSIFPQSHQLTCKVRWEYYGMEIYKEHTGTSKEGLKATCNVKQPQNAEPLQPAPLGCRREGQVSLTLCSTPNLSPISPLPQRQRHVRLAPTPSCQHTSE